MVYCDYRNPPCNNEAEKLGLGWYEISFAGMKPKYFCCKAHAIYAISDPVKHCELDDLEDLKDKDGNDIRG